MGEKKENINLSFAGLSQRLVKVKYSVLNYSFLLTAKTKGSDQTSGIFLLDFTCALNIW